MSAAPRLDENEYLPIQSLDIEAETRITFDLYVNLPLNQKYILYRKKGGTLDNQKLENFNLNNVKNFFVHKSEYNDFVKYAALRIRDLIGNGDKVENKKLMTQAAKSILSSTFGDYEPAVTEALMGNLNDITGVIIQSILADTTSYNRKTFQKFLDLAQKGTHFQRHPVNVASIAILIAFGIGYSNQQILADIAMSALLHDVGLSRIPPVVILKAHRSATLNFQERELLYKHPQMAVDILKERKIELTHVAEMIILQHHEEFNGFGYPQGLRGFNVNEFAQIVRVADELDQLILEGIKNKAGLKMRTLDLLDGFHRDKVIEPGLCLRIRNIMA